MKHNILIGVRASKVKSCVSSIVCDKEERNDIFFKRIMTSCQTIDSYKSQFFLEETSSPGGPFSQSMRSRDLGCGPTMDQTNAITTLYRGPSSCVLFDMESVRIEAIQNLYHAMEEVIAMIQTAELWGVVDLKRAILSLRTDGRRVLPHIRSLYSLLFMEVRIDESSPSSCTRILPLRACRGSVLPYSWMPFTKEYVCPSKLLMSVRHHFPTLIGGSPQGRKEGIMIDRRFAASRRLAFPYALKECYERKHNVSLRILDVKVTPFRKQMELAKKSSLLVGSHGAGLSHMTWMEPEGKVIEHSPYPLSSSSSRSVANIYRNWAMWLGLSYTHRIGLRHRRC